MHACRFHGLLASRARGADAAALADALAGASPGRAPDLWAALPLLRPRLLFVAGALDAKFAALAARMAAAANGGGTDACGGLTPGSGGLDGLAAPDASSQSAGRGELGDSAAAKGGTSDRGPCGGPALAPVNTAACAVVAGAGHAVHLERPEALVRVLATFLDA